MFFKVCFLTVVLATLANAGDEYPARIPDKIAKCYSNPELMNRYNRMPMSMDNLIALIKKVEAHSDTQLWDIGKMTGTLLKRFRYNGIVDVANPAPGLLPVQRNPVETDKHRLTWTLTPGSESDFPETSLTDAEKCAMHWMLSYSVNHTMRAEEKSPGARTFVDTEPVDSIPDTPLQSSEDNNWQEAAAAAAESVHEDHHDNHEEASEEESRDINHDTDVEEPHHHDDEHEDSFFGRRRRRETFHAGSAHSLHPLELGVVQTKWGTVAAGTVLSGIAAGLSPETVQLRDLIKDVINEVSETSLNRTIRSPWAVTLAGDMAQSALLRASTNELSVIGPRGSWNSSTCPKEFSLEKDDPSLLTVSEIYGGIDGLLMASRIESWATDYIKLSTILEMYYSKSGMYPERQYRACNRINNFKEKVDATLLKEQALNSALVYYAKGIADVPQLSPDARPIDIIGGFVNRTYNLVNNFLNDKEQIKLDFEECFGQPTQTDPSPTSAVDLTFVVDQSMDETDIRKQKDLIGALVTAMDVQRGGSRIEIVSSKDASVFSGFDAAVNKADLACSVSKLSITKGERRIADVLTQMRSRIINERKNEKQNRVGGSSGRVILFLVSSYTANTSEKDKIKAELATLLKEAPDVRLMFVTTANPEEFSLIVQEPDKDIIRLNNYLSYAAAAPDIAERLKSIPARIVYPACASLAEASSETFYNYSSFLKTDTVQYLRIDPYQFFSSNALTLKVKLNYGIGTVCLSRSKRYPGSGDTCKSSTTAGETVDLRITQPCGRVGGPEACQPIYFSVKNTIADNTLCGERNCTSPYDVKFVVAHEGMRCNSATSELISQLLVAVAVIFSFLLNRKA